jgi:transposase
MMVSGELCAKRLVFVDEMGSNTSLHELYAYSPRGERAYCSVARNRGKNTTLLSSMSLSGMGPSMVVEGGTDGAVFEGYLRQMLVPALKEGDVVVMDNLSVHKSERVREMIEGAGAEVLYLPPYSPDFNPIEICQPQCAFEHKLSYHRPQRAARATGVGREARSRPYFRRRGGAAMSSRGAVPPRP